MAKIDRLVKQLSTHLDPDEQVDAAVLGHYEAKVLGQNSIRAGVLVATDRRLVFYTKKITGFDFESFPYANISSFEVSKNFMGHAFRFYASGNDVRLKWVHKGDIDRFTAVVRERAGNKSRGGAQPSTVLGTGGESLVGQIERLARLRDRGVLTEDEFQAQKARLMS